MVSSKNITLHNIMSIVHLFRDIVAELNVKFKNQSIYTTSAV